MNNVKEAKIVRASFIAKKLLQLGYQIKDIKPNRLNRERTVFVFEKTNELLRDIEIIESEYK